MFCHWNWIEDILQVFFESHVNVENVTVWVSNSQSRANELTANEYKVTIGNDSASLSSGSINAADENLCGSFHDGKL